MNKLVLALTIVSILSLGVVVNSHAGSMAQNDVTIFNSTKLIGAMVKARDGVELGRILDVLITSQGNVGFAIVRQVNLEDPWPGHIVAVPFGALTISKGKSQSLQVVFNGDKEKFYEAPEAPPSFLGTEGQVNLQTVAALDRYFGVQPCWTEGGQMSGSILKHSTSGSTPFKRPVGLAPHWAYLVQ